VVPVPYSGKVAINTVNFHGNAEFTFSLHDGNGTSHWRNGADANQSIQVFVSNGRYSVLLGGQGMNTLPPELFLNHDKLYLKVEFDNGDGAGLRHLAPDQLITATPRALVAEWAKMARLAEGVLLDQSPVKCSVSKSSLNWTQTDHRSSVGPITRDMLPASVLNDLNKTIVITRDMLPQDVQDDLNQSVVITRDMLPQDVQDDLNKTVVITRSMLPADVLNDLNHSIAPGSISFDMLAPEVRSDLNRTITKSMLGSDVLADLNQSIKTVSREMLPASVLADLNRTITKSMLESDVLADLNKTITRDMLPQDVREDLNKSIVITRDMLPASVLNDLNKSFIITRDMLPQEVLADLNRTITLNDLDTQVITDLNNSIGSRSITLDMLSNEVSTALKPAISGDPQSIVSVEGARAVLEVDPTGGNVSYQWKKNGVNVSGATLRVLEISDLNASQHEGNYTVVVSNAFGSVISSVAEIDLNGSLTEGLLGWWKFDETNGTIAYDSSGNGNDGNLTNGPAWTSGKIGGALSFDGVDDRVKIPHTILDQKLAFTVSLWFNMKMGSDGSYHALITGANSSNSNAFTFEKRPDHNIMIRDMGEISISTAKTSDFWTATWRHVTIAKSSVGIVFYLSGEEFDSKNYSTATMSVDANGLWIGPDQDSVGGGWQDGQSVKGELDDFRIYDRALSPFEVRALHKLGEQPVGSVVAGSGTVVNGEVADGAVTASKLANNTITTSQLNEQILKYLKPEITTQPQAQTVYGDTNASFSVTAEGKYLTYQWKKDGVDLTGETNATLNITDANATLHDGNYSVVVSNDFGSVESGVVEVHVSDALLDGLVGWWKFDETNGTIAYDSSGNGNDGNLTNGPTWATGKIGGALSFDGVDDYVNVASFELGGELSLSFWVNCTEFKSWSRFLDFADGYSDNQLFYSNSASTSQFAFIYKITANNYKNIFVNTTLNSWAHYAGIIRGNGDYEAYKSGSIQASASGGPLPPKLSRSYHYFGKSNSSGDPSF
jgi:hypothetical protein